MKIKNLIAKVDRLKPNTVDDEDKFDWINQLEADVFEKVYARAADTTFTYEPKVWVAGMEAELLIPDSYSDIYLFYIFAQIDYLMGEITNYNNDMSMFNERFDDFAAFYRRNHMPKEG